MLICTSYLSLIDTHRHTHKHHPIFQIRLFHGSFPPSSPLKMTVADISTHLEGKRADISSWVTKLGSNYIALSRKPWLLPTRPDIWSVSSGYQFCFLSPIQHWVDSLCYVFWMHSWTIRYCFTGRMVLCANSSLAHTFTQVIGSTFDSAVLNNLVFSFVSLSRCWSYCDLHIQHLISLSLIKLWSHTKD